MAKAAWASGWAELDAAGLAPRSNALRATLASLLARHGFNVAPIVVMCVDLAARRLTGHPTSGRRTTLDNIELFRQHTLLQRMLALGLLQ